MAKTVVSNHPPSTALVAGKYQLIKMVGRGGMGSVWEGRHTSLGTRVAIKFIEAEYANSQEAVSRFENEAKAAARIDSKHAIKIYDHGVTEDGKPFIVMEMLMGEPLDKRIEKLGRLPLQDVARIFHQVARGLGRAHEIGIIHRDLKPENIFLVKTPDDDDEYAKVLDFGIAKIKGSAGEQLSNSTKTGAVLGTPYFMSPEQARGLRDIDARTDLWSLGVIVFKCVTGVLPFDGESLGDLLVKICTTQIPVPSQVLPGLPSGFDNWFARALERDPSKRFSTAIEMSTALSFACGVSVRQPGVADPMMGSARTAIATPSPFASPMQSPFPGQVPGYAGGGTPQPNQAGQSGQHGQVSRSGNYGQAPVANQYGSVPPRASNPGITPAPAAFATQGPLTASTPHAKTGSSGMAIAAAIGALALVIGLVGVGFLVMKGPTTTATTAPAVSTKVDTTPDPTTAATAIKSAAPAVSDSASSKPPEVATAEPTTKPHDVKPGSSHSHEHPATAPSAHGAGITRPAGFPQPGSTGTANSGQADQSGF